MLHNHEQHHSLTHHMFHSEISRVFLFRMLNGFSSSLIFVFIPLFLYKNGISLQLILWYAIMVYAGVICCNFFTFHLINKIGLKYTILISIPFHLANFVFIQFVPDNTWFLIPAALVYAVHLSLYWNALDGEFAQQGHQSKRAKEMGTLKVFMILVSTFSPFIGGFILQMYDYTILVVIAVIIALFSIAPLFFVKDKKTEHVHESYTKSLFFVKSKKSRIFFLSQGANIILALYIWPIALFMLTDQNYLNLGGILTVTSLISALIILVIKNRLTISSEKKTLKKTANVYSIEYVLKAVSYFSFAVTIYLAEIIAKINSSIFDLAFVSMFFKTAERTNYLKYIMSRDFFSRLGRVVFGLFLILVFYIFGESREVIFAVLIFGSFLSFGFKLFEME